MSVPGDPFAAAVAALRRPAQRPAWAPAFQPFAPAPHDASLACVAVDGSHAVLADTGAVWVVATTAAALAWPGMPSAQAFPAVHAVLADEAQQRLDERYAAAGLDAAPRAASAEAFAEALRSVDEMEEARHALAHAEAGSLVLVDGALHGLPPGPARLAHALTDAAQVRGVALAGVAKRSALAVAGAPAVAAADAAASAARVPAPWRCGVPGTAGVHVARLHAGAEFAYRIDVAGAWDDASWANLAALARDAAYCGYPYPLAAAHNHVALTGPRVAALRQGLEAAVRAAGPEVARLVRDPHAMLDRSV